VSSAFDDLFAEFGAGKESSQFDDLFESVDSPTGSSRPSILGSIGRGIKNVYHAIEEAPAIAASYYGDPLEAPTILSEGAVPEPPSMAELVQHSGRTADQEKTAGYGETLGRKLGGFAAETLSSPTNAALMLATGGLGKLATAGGTATAAIESGALVPEAAAAATKAAQIGRLANVGSRAASLGFAGQMIPGAIEGARQTYEGYQREGFTPEVTGEAAVTLANALMAAGALKHGISRTPELGPRRSTEAETNAALQKTADQALLDRVAKDKAARQAGLEVPEQPPIRGEAVREAIQERGIPENRPVAEPTVPIEGPQETVEATFAESSVPDTSISPERRTGSETDRRTGQAPVDFERRVSERRAKILDEDPSLTGGAANRIAQAEVRAEVAETKAVTDPLTGLKNKAGWEELEKTVNESTDQVFVADMSGLKGLNDELGHKAGDQAIQQFATEFKRHFGEETARNGGDEHAGVMRNMSTEDAQAMAGEFIEGLKKKRISVEMPDGSVVDYPFGVHLGLGRNFAEADAASNIARDLYGSGRKAAADPNLVRAESGAIGSAEKGRTNPAQQLDIGGTTLPPTPVEKLPPQVQALSARGPVRPIPNKTFFPGDEVVVSVSGKQQPGIVVHTPEMAETTGPRMVGKAKVRLQDGRSLYIRPEAIIQRPPVGAREAVSEAGRAAYARESVQTTPAEIKAQPKTHGPVDTTAKPSKTPGEGKSAAPFNLSRMSLSESNKELLGRMYESAPEKYEQAKGGKMTFDDFRDMGLKVAGVVDAKTFEKALKEGAPLSDPGLVVYAKELMDSRSRELATVKTELDNVIAQVGEKPTSFSDRVLLEAAQQKFLQMSVEKANLDLSLAGAQAQAARTLVAMKILSQERGPIDRLINKIFAESC
jgi:diguanylate cyclase (GGDEF)-like protein